MDYSTPDSSVHEFTPARILEWLPFCSPGDLPDPGIELVSPVLASWFFNNCAIWEACSFCNESVVYLNSHREALFCLLMLVQAVVIVTVALVCSLFDVFWCKSLPSPKRPCTALWRLSSNPDSATYRLYQPGRCRSLYVLSSLVCQIFIEHQLYAGCCVWSWGYNGEQK